MADFVLGDRVLDFGLNVLDEEADKIYICSAEPTNYTQATETFALGSKTAAGAIFWSVESGVDFSRRVISSKSFSDGVVTTGGTAVYWAVVDSVNQRLLARGLIGGGGGSVSAGGTFALGSFEIGLGAAVEAGQQQAYGYPFPGQEGFEVGHTAHPDWNTGANPNGAGQLAALTEIGDGTGGTFLLQSGTPESPTIIKFKDFRPSTLKANSINDNGGYGGAAVHDIRFEGCRFQGNCGPDTYPTACIATNYGSYNIEWSYCTMCPRIDLHPTPVPALAWPSSSVGTGINTWSPDQGDYQIPYDTAFRDCMSITAPLAGFVKVDHCDMWGGGDLITTSASGWWTELNTYPPCGPIEITNNWIHDTRQQDSVTYPSNNNYHDHTNGFMCSNASGSGNLLFQHNTLSGIGNTNAFGFQHILGAPGLEPNGVVGEGVWEDSIHYQLTGYIEFAGQPASGNTIVLNGATVTYGTDITIGGSLGTTLTNTINFLNGSGNAQISKCTYTTNGTNRVAFFFKTASGPGSSDTYTWYGGTTAVYPGYTTAVSGTNLWCNQWCLTAPVVGALDGFAYVAIRDSTNLDPANNAHPEAWTQYSVNSYRNIHIINNHVSGFNNMIDLGIGLSGNQGMRFEDNVISNAVMRGSHLTYSGNSYNGPYSPDMRPMFAADTTNSWARNVYEVWSGSSAWDADNAGKNGWFVHPHSVNGPEEEDWDNGDGYLGAPAGSPQYPNMLDLSSATNGLGHDLAVRPPWRVAGVDYRAGCPIDAGSFGSNVAVSGGAFTSEFDTKLATFGGTVNKTFPLVEIVNSDIVNFDGWDLRGVIFDLGRMYGSGGAACNDISFTNCLIGGANTGWQYIGNPGGNSIYTASIIQYNGVGSTIKNCTFDGGFTGILMVSNFARFLSLNIGVGHPVDVRYNWFKGSSQQIKRLAGQGSVTFKYNFIDDTFVGAGYYADITAVGPGASNGTGGNLIRVTTDTGRGMSTGFVCEISDVIGIPALTSNPGTHWTVNVIADNVFDLQGSTFSGTYGGGGHFAGNSINNIYNHPNYQEFDMAGASGDLSIDWSFNTTYQATVYGAMGPQMWPGFSIPGVYSPKVTNNTMIAINESIQYFIQGTFGSFTAHPGTIGTPVIGENYFDTSGVIVGPFYGDTDWPLWSRTNNIVMQDGSTLIPT